MSITAADQLSTRPTRASSVTTPHIEQPTKLSHDLLADEAGHLRNTVELLSGDVAEIHDDSLMLQLSARADEAAKRSPTELLDELSDRGFSWTAIARVVGVSVPAVRKWRQGQPASAASRMALARLVALIGVLEGEHHVSDPAGWLELPIAESAYTGVDVLVSGNESGLIKFAANHLTGPELLDQTSATWRDERDSRFEVVHAGDGAPAIRLREEADGG